MMLYCVHLRGKFRKIHLLGFSCVSVCLCLTCKNLRTADGFHEIFYGLVLLKFVDLFIFGKS